MFVVGLLSWWYGVGWKQRASIYREKIASLVDYFSIDLLVKTLFAPYRQISAGKISGPIGVQWRAFVDRLISRLIGAVVRSIILLVGIISIVLATLIYGLTFIIWGFIPLLPFIGVILWLSGWTLL